MTMPAPREPERMLKANLHPPLLTSSPNLLTDQCPEAGRSAPFRAQNDVGVGYNLGSVLPRDPSASPPCVAMVPDEAVSDDGR